MSKISMVSKKFIFLLILVVIIGNIFPLEFYSQNKRIVKKSSSKSKTSRKISSKLATGKKIISGGVMNGKARNLVKPIFPPSARLVNARGTVAIEVLIDEKGDVIEAKVLRGNPLLISNSLKAAKSSKFVPVLLSGEPRKVSGVILYNYIRDRINWLEIGYAFEVAGYIFSQSLENYLPSGFDEEKQLLTQLNLVQLEQQSDILQSVSSSIENKLSSDEKNRWLFLVGKELGNLSNRYWDKSDDTLDKIQNLIYIAPENVSPVLIRSLEKLISAAKENPYEFNSTLTSLIERLYGLGN